MLTSKQHSIFVLFWLAVAAIFSVLAREPYPNRSSTANHSVASLPAPANASNSTDEYEYALVVDAGSSGSRIHVFRIASVTSPKPTQGTREGSHAGGALRVEVARDENNKAVTKKVLRCIVLLEAVVLFVLLL